MSSAPENRNSFATHIVVATLAVGALIFLAACGDSEPEPGPTSVPPPATQVPPATPSPTRIPAPSVLRSSATLLTDNSLIAEVRVTLDRQAKVAVEYGNPDAGSFRTALSESAAEEHVVPLVRLRPETSYDYTVLIADEGNGELDGGGGSFTTGPLPEALERLEFTIQGRPTPELILFDLQDNPDSYFVMIDQDSNVVWYHRNEDSDPEQPTSIRAIRQKPNGNFVYWEGGPTGRRFNCCLKEITPIGKLVDRLVNNEVDKFVHHDLLILPDDKVLYVAHEIVEIDDTANGGTTSTQVLIESLREWDQSNHMTREIWNSLDHYSTDTRVRWQGDPVSWLHTNSLNIGPRGNYILSLRAINQIVSISPSGQSIEWRLGGPDSSYDFEDPTDRFYGQHTATELPNGNIILFDNGNDRPEEDGGEYSRALELTLNTYELVAKKVWEYRPDPDLYAGSRSSAYRLETGNTLVNFETNDSDPPRVIVEVAPDGTEVWKLEMRSESVRNSYRAYPYESVWGETRVR